MLFKQNARVDQPAKAPEAYPTAGSEGREQRPFKPESAPSVAKEPKDAGVAREGHGNVLTVGQGIKLKGEITACDRLVVEGHVEVSLNETRAVEIRPSGQFIGSCEVEEAEISGTYQGELTVRGRLIVRATGQATGKIQYGEIELERGGRIAGELSVRDSAKSVAAKMIETVQAQRTTGSGGAHKVA